jgi:hypothetical protein
MPRMREPEKSAKGDQVIFEMNQLLRGANERSYESFASPVYPLLFVIGVPRSGTTLLSQLISTHLNVAYINNLVASFWSAPLYGIALSEKIVKSRHQSTFRSEYGKTKGLEEPHEFGFFWKELFGYDMRFQPTEEIEESIDWNRIQRVLRNLVHAYGRAVTFKYLPICWHLAQLKSALPEAVFVRVKRDPLESACSLIRFRLQGFGSNDYMASLIPTSLQALGDRPYWVQVAGQVFFIEKILDEQLATVPPLDVLDLDYEKLCSAPRGALEQVAAMLVGKGYEAKIETEPPEEFEISRTALRPQIEKEVEKALEEFYGIGSIGY